MKRKKIKNFAEKKKGELVSTKYKGVIWMKPKLVGTVQYMQETDSGSMRQPV